MPEKSEYYRKESRVNAKRGALPGWPQLGIIFDTDYAGISSRRLQRGKASVQKIIRMGPRVQSLPLKSKVR